MPLQASGSLSGELQGPLNALGARGTLRTGCLACARFLKGQRLQATFTATQIPTAPQATLRAQLVNIQGPTLAPSSVSVEGTYATQQGTFTVAVTEGPYQRSRLVGNVNLAAGQRLTLKTLRLQHQDLVWENAAPVKIVYSPKGVLQIQRLDLRSGIPSVSAWRARLTHKVSYRVRCRCSSCKDSPRCRPSLRVLLCQTGAWIWC